MPTPKVIVLARVASATTARRRYRILLMSENRIACTCRAGCFGQPCRHLALFRAALTAKAVR